jgi:L-malate glycosyltransferase
MSEAKRIDQAMAGFSDGDAISHEAVILQNNFKSMGFESNIYADSAHIAPTMKDACQPLESLSTRRSDVVIHHYSISSPAVDAYLSSKARKILIYHNITPAKYFMGFADDAVTSLTAAREQMVQAARQSDAVWAASKFDASELEAAGVRNVNVFALPFDPAVIDVQPEPYILNRFSDKTLKNLLFVGRIAPNKHIEDLILAFAWYNQTINPYSRLLLVGSQRSAPRYYMMLRMLANELNLTHVCFEGFASQAGLAAYYEIADVFVCASEHEGYCLPLVEAMHKGIPVVARRTGGTPEALGGAGVLYEDLSHNELAELVHRVLTDAGLHETIVNSQKKRMTEVLGRNLEKELRSLLNGVV